MKHVFVYGTLLNDEVFRLFVAGQFKKTIASLWGYQRVKVKGECYPAIVPDKRSMVEGLLIYDLMDKDIHALDHYEGDYYQRQTVTVTLPNDESQTCEAYVFKPEYQFLLVNEPWSNQLFRRQHLAPFIQGWLDNIAD